MDRIQLTYIIPVYNTEPFVLKCLQSVVNQGLQENQYEVLVVNDGSTDSSQSIVETFALEHPQVRLLNQENAGVSAARNFALDNARGTYIQFVDSDDYLAPGMMAPLLERAMDDNLDVLMFNFMRCEKDDTVHIVERPKLEAVTTGVMSGADFLTDHRLMPYVCWYLVRRDYLELRGLRFDRSLMVCEDGALIADFLLNAPRVAYCDETPYHYVNRSGSAMHNTDPGHQRRRIFSQIDAAVSIDKTAGAYATITNKTVPASVLGLRNVYLYFSMTKALTSGNVDVTLAHMRENGLYPFPCIGPDANYYGMKWKLIHKLMMCPPVWKCLSHIYRWIKK